MSCYCQSCVRCSRRRCYTPPVRGEFFRIGDVVRYKGQSSRTWEVAGFVGQGTGRVRLTSLTPRSCYDRHRSPHFSAITKL